MSKQPTNQRHKSYIGRLLRGAGAVCALLLAYLAALVAIDTAGLWWYVATLAMLVSCVVLVVAAVRSHGVSD